ncbi:hypothetical protein [Sinomonas flava]|uniref:hypothetical protein n=1 Tax=Sinomonas flava TaxID=496857 RepID=UPI0039A5681A
MDLTPSSIPTPMAARQRGVFRGQGRRRIAALVAAAGAIGFALTGCGNSTAASSAPSAQAVDPALANGASGALSICGGRDSVGLYKGTVEAFMKANPGITAKYTVLGATTDESRTQAVQRLQAKSSECDLYLTDVTWTPEFASRAGFRT